jgi:hypothetical protein
MEDIVLVSPEIEVERIARLKVAYAVRRVDVAPPVMVVDGVPRHGDLVLARVTKLGQHTRLELATSRRSTLYVGDEIVVAYGARYAPDQFEADLPADLGPCHLVAAGGVAGAVRSKHSSVQNATEIAPVGLLARPDGSVLNVADGALPALDRPKRWAPTVLVAGTAMNAGKTTAAASLVHGLALAGLRVGAGKLTGTGAGGDRYSYADAGAAEVLDFTDLGLVSTFQVPPATVVQAAISLHAHLIDRDVDAVVLEVADGLLCAETAAMLDAPAIRGLADGTIFAASDAAGAVAGVHLLRERRIRPLAVSGVLTASPLAVREAQAELDLPIYGQAELADPETARSVLRRLTPSAGRAAQVTGAGGARPQTASPAA